MRKREDTSAQMSLDDLLNDGELHQLEISPDDIGGELLAVLTKGLYTNPMDCIREYVQNAVDAGANNVKIKITGNSVLIRDDGRGMNLEDLLQARQFGLSYKLIDEHVGFRGIGIYSGFDLCRSLRLTTSKKGDPLQHVIVFEFAAMKDRLEHDRKDSTGRVKTSLLKLLSEHTYIKRESSNFPAGEGFTLIELQDINDFHIQQLLDRAKLKMYLLRNLPVDFADSFAHKEEINQNLRRQMVDYRAIKIDLESDGVEDDTVDKYGGLDVQRPVFGTIMYGKTQIAYYWACMTTKPELLEKEVQHDHKKYAGFVYKVKGFTVGDRDNPRKSFAKRVQMYPWYTGEIYVLDPDIVPNAERNDFETNTAKQNLELALRMEVDSKLLPAVLGFQAEKRAEEILRRCQDEMNEIHNWLNVNGTSTKSARFETELDVYSSLDKVIEDLSKQKKSLPAEKRNQADEVLENAKRQKKQIAVDLKNATPQSTRKKREAKKDSSTNQEDTSAGSTTEPSQPPPPKTLQSILTDAGWSFEADTRSLVDIIQSSLEEVLVYGSVSYTAVIDQIENKINNGEIII